MSRLACLAALAQSAPALALSTSAAAEVAAPAVLPPVSSPLHQEPSGGHGYVGAFAEIGHDIGIRGTAGFEGAARPTGQGVWYRARVGKGGTSIHGGQLMRAALALALVTALPAAAVAQPSAAPSPALPAAPLPLAVAPAPRSFYVSAELAAGMGNATMFDLGIEVGRRIPGTNVWGRLRGSVGGWAHIPDGGTGSIVQGLVGVEGRSPDRAVSGFAGIDLGVARLARDPYDDFGDPVPDPEALGAIARPRVGVDIGAGAARLRLSVAAPLIYARGDMALALMLGVGGAFGD
jgi:hypothetical protein